MDKLNFLNDLSKKLSEALPKNLQTLQKDIEKNFHVVLQSAFNKLDLVTRDEFDAQTKVLARSRKKIETLEEKVKELEKLVARKTKTDKS
jgi:BMFP domain-containing protein YqiC